MKPTNRITEAIARKRDSAGQIRIEDLPKGATLLGVIPIAGSLFLVSENSVHQVKMADDIDPDRTNFNLGNTQQKVIGRGSNSPAIYKTILTADVLSKPSLRDKSKTDSILSLAFEAGKDLSAMLDQQEALLTSERHANEVLKESRALPSSIVIPHFEGIEGFVKSFIQKADHILRALLETIKIFYSENYCKGYFEGFRNKLLILDADEDFARYITGNLDYIKFIREARNCVEHPKTSKKAIIKSYHLLPNGNISSPTIEIIHPSLGQSEVHLSDFCAGLIEGVGNIYEDTLAYLYDRKSDNIGPATFNVFLYQRGRESTAM